MLIISTNLNKCLTLYVWEQKNLQKTLQTLSLPIFNQNVAIMQKLKKKGDLRYVHF